MLKLSDAEIEDFARRMIETGADEDTLYDPDRWHNYLEDVFKVERDYIPSLAQHEALEVGAQMQRQRHILANISIQHRYPRGQHQYSYRDLRTGRFITAPEAYTRLMQVGGTAPAKLKYKWQR